MNLAATKYVMVLFEKFGTLMQLPKPKLEYVTLIQEYLSNQKWFMRDLKQCLGWLLTDQEYLNNTARFNKFPQIVDFIRAKKTIDDKIINYCMENRITSQEAQNQIHKTLIENLTRNLSIQQYDEDIPY